MLALAFGKVSWFCNADLQRKSVCSTLGNRHVCFLHVWQTREEKIKKVTRCTVRMSVWAPTKQEVGV